MLTRRHIRVKVMQGIYALQHSKDSNLKDQELFLQKSMANMFTLYTSLLALLLELKAMAENQLEVSSKKYIKETTTNFKNPSKFADNAVLKLLSEDSFLLETIESKKLKIWYLNPEYVKILFKEITSSKVYINYMESDEISFDADRDFIVEIFKNIIAPNDKLYEFLEDDQLTWIDDLPIVNTFLLKKLKKLTDYSTESLLPALKVDKEDLDFGLNLLRKCSLKSEELIQQYVDKTANWDKERIADLDAILLQMAICEFMNFPSIPVRVSLNEYLEIAKEYSSPKSSIFINGILDTVSNELKESGKLKKSGRGLL
jgi:N utilization substance protein B